MELSTKKRLKAWSAGALALVLLLLPAAGLTAEGSATDGDFDYIRLQSGVAVMKYRGDAAEVVIPAEIDGMPVQAVGTEAFAWNPLVAHVVMPDSVQIIGLKAFIGCTGLREVDWPENLLAIGLEAFRDCTALESVCLPPVTGFISEAAFAGCSALGEVILPKGLFDIGPLAFSDCTNLRQVTVFGDTTTGALFPEDAPFAGCENLEQFVYGGTVEGLADLVPAELRDGLCTFFVSMNEIAQAVEVRACQAPAGDLVIPARLGTAQLTAFAEDAFAGEDDIGHVFFLGTRADWEKIAIGAGNAPLRAGNVTCLLRDAVSVPLAPCWDAKSELVTGISIADLGDMPLRGLDLQQAAWTEPEPSPSQTQPVLTEPDGPKPTAEPGTPTPTAGPTGSDEPGEPEPAPTAAPAVSGEPDEPVRTLTEAPTDPAEPGEPAPDESGEPEPAASESPADPDEPGADVPPQETDEPAGPEPIQPSEPLYKYAFFREDGEALSRYEILGTGSRVTRTDERASRPKTEEARIVVSGDVTGSGVMNIAQLVRMARALTGEAPLTGPYLRAADLDGNGHLDIGDMTKEASWLVQYGMPAGPA